MKVAALITACLLLAACGSSSTNEVPGAEATRVRIPKGAGGVGFLPLLVMEKQHLVEKHAKAAGLDLQVEWLDLGGPSVMNDALLAGQIDYMAAGPPAFLTLWDRTRGSADVRGVAAIASIPMYLNVRAPHLEKLHHLSAQDKIAVTAIKVSIPAILMQMYALNQLSAVGDDIAQFDKYTVSMTHPDAVVALLSGSGAISGHFTSPPFHQREIADPRVRTILTSTDVMGGSSTFTMLSTTAQFRERNPKINTAVLRALEEANAAIAADKKMAAELLFASAGGAGFSADELVTILNDPAIRFTTTPENSAKYAQFMHSIGSLKTLPTAWTDLFFPEIHGAPGN